MCFAAGIFTFPFRSRQRIAFSALVSTASGRAKSILDEAFAPCAADALTFAFPADAEAWRRKARLYLENGFLPLALHAILHEAPDPIPPTVAPAFLSRILDRALAKSLDDRYQSCSEVLAEVALLEAAGNTTPEVSQRLLARLRPFLGPEKRRGINTS